jgi:type III secretion protein U
MAGEKTLEPSDHKLEQARKKGQVPVSKDFAHCIVFGVGLELTFALEATVRKQMSQLFDLALSASRNNFQDIFSNILVVSGTILFLSFLVFAIANVVLGVLGYWGQFGVLFSATPVTPDITKLNPINYFQNIFTEKKLFEIVSSLSKMGVFGLMAYVITLSELPDIVMLASGDLSMIYAASVTLIHGLLRVLVGISIVLAVIDFFVQRRAHIKQNRMDFEEMFREYKEMEGDPEVKGARKQIAYELANSDPVSNTENANAVVVNPTHFAVAMLFDPQKAPVPIVCAKGCDDVARAMIGRAQQKSIPVIRHVWLARTLYATAKEKKTIPRSLFDPVALLYSVVEQMKEQGGKYFELDNSERPPNNI